MTERSCGLQEDCATLPAGARDGRRDTSWPRANERGETGFRRGVGSSGPAARAVAPSNPSHAAHPWRPRDVDPGAKTKGVTRASAKTAQWHRLAGHRAIQLPLLSFEIASHATRMRAKPCKVKNPIADSMSPWHVGWGSSRVPGIRLPDLTHRDLIQDMLSRFQEGSVRPSTRLHSTTIPLLLGLRFYVSRIETHYGNCGAATKRTESARTSKAVVGNAMADCARSERGGRMIFSHGRGHASRRMSTGHALWSQPLMPSGANLQPVESSPPPWARIDGWTDPMRLWNQ
jgi:hypothetical protein